MTSAVYEARNQLPCRQIDSSQNRHWRGIPLLEIAGFISKYRFLISLVIFLGFILSPQLTSLAQAPKNNSNTPSYQGIFTRNETENYYLNAINKLRATKKLPLLVIDNRLSVSAYKKGEDMVNKNYWSHYSPSGISFADFIWSGSPKAETVGENLAKCFDSKQSVFDALAASPAHYAIMTGRYTNFGVSEVKNINDGCIYTVMHLSFYKG